MDLDAVSARILEKLQQDSDLPLAELAKAVGVSASPCWRRVNDMRQSGVIRRSVAVVDPLAIGLTINVFVQVTLEKQNEQALRSFQNSITRRPEVMECYLMSGDADYLLRVVVEDLTQFHRFVIDHLTMIPGVANVRSSFALEQVKYTTALPTEHLIRRATTGGPGSAKRQGK